MKTQDFDFSFSSPLQYMELIKYKVNRTKSVGGVSQKRNSKWLTPCCVYCQGRTGTKNQPGTLDRPTSGGVLVTYPTGPHRPSGPLQYRPIGFRPERPDGQSATVYCTVLYVSPCFVCLPNFLCRRESWKRGVYFENWLWAWLQQFAEWALDSFRVGNIPQPNGS